MLGVDYSSGRADPKRLKAANVGFVCRYLSTPGNPKNLTADESLALRRAGLKIVTVFETTAKRALGGRAAGIVDARAAAAQLRLLGAPVDAPCYFAVDFDATPAEQPAINAYLAGAASQIGVGRTGVYGGFYVVKRALDAGVCHYAWQTSAWSGRQWDLRAHIQQRNGGNLAGVDVDYDVTQVDDFGQWFAAKTPPKTKPTPPPPALGPMPADDTFWVWLRWYLGIGEFQQFGRRDPHVRPNVPAKIPAAWWRALRTYLKEGSV